MEKALNMSATSFAPLTFDELMEIDGGSATTGRMIMVVGGAVVAGIVAPLTCGGSLAAYAAVAATGYGMMFTGAFDW